MSKLQKVALLLAIPVIGLIAGYFLMAHPVTIIVNGETREIVTRALTVRGALRSAGYHVSKTDSVTPSVGNWLSKTTKIVYETSRIVEIWLDSESKITEVKTAAATPREILQAAGMTPGSEDKALVNGKTYELDESIPLTHNFVLQYIPAVTVAVDSSGNRKEFQTSASIIGQALWDAGIKVLGGDSLTPGFDTMPMEGLEFTLKKGVPVEINVDGKVIHAISASMTVGKALLESGYPLEDLDYSVPAEEAPLPSDGKIKIVRVTEQILYEQKTIPYTTDFVPDPELELDQHRVVEEGSVGLQTARIRVRLEDGVEKSRVTEDFVTLKDPVTRQEAFGTKIVYHTIDTPDGPITYYRAITVTATSYSPCNSGVSECLYGTSTPGVAVKKGVIAVRIEWYRLLKGSQMYVPGYGIGTIYDTGYYPYNPMWIDLGFTDAEFKLYGKFYPSITVYFLAPAPANVPAILP